MTSFQFNLHHGLDAFVRYPGPILMESYEFISIPIPVLIIIGVYIKNILLYIIYLSSSTTYFFIFYILLVDREDVYCINSIVVDMTFSSLLCVVVLDIIDADTAVASIEAVVIVFIVLPLLWWW